MGDATQNPPPRKTPPSATEIAERGCDCPRENAGAADARQAGAGAGLVPETQKKTRCLTTFSKSAG